MIIVNQNGGFLCALHFLEDSFCKLPVDCFILLPVCLTEDGARVRDVAEGPKAFIGKAEIKPVFFLFGQQTLRNV